MVLKGAWPEVMHALGTCWLYNNYYCFLVLNRFNHSIGLLPSSCSCFVIMAHFFKFLLKRDSKRLFGKTTRTGLGDMRSFRQRLILTVVPDCLNVIERY